MRISERVSSLKPSATVAVANRAMDLRRAGVGVLSFAAGEPDFDTPNVIKEAAIAALAGGQTKYMPTLGDPETREAIADKLRRENNLSGVTWEHVAISAGVKHALYVSLQCLLDTPSSGSPPAEVVLPTPAWVSYAPLVELAGGRVVEVATTAASGFRATPDRIAAAVTPRTVAIILNSPSNPCATMYSEAELRALAAAIAERAERVAPDLLIITDEIYEKIVFDGNVHFSIGSIPEVAQRTLTLNGFSKAVAMTGWRAGYAAIPGEYGKRFIKAMAALQGQMTTNLTSFVYPAMRTALTRCAPDIERMRAAFERRGRLMFDRMSAIPGLACNRPMATFYLFPDVSAHFGKTTAGGTGIDSALAFAEALLVEQQVAAVPGEDFGGPGAQHVRFSFACSEAQIEEGVERIATFVAGLR